MKYYTIQVKTRSERKYMKLFKALHPMSDLEMFFPLKEMPVRKLGVIKDKTSPILPGYIFLELDDDDSIRNYYWELRKTDGFFRFLKSNQDIQPLTGNSLEVILYLLKKVGPVAGKSKVVFDENSRIMVLEGPLKGFEGKIIKVDKRKGRARVKLDIYDESHSIDLAFEVMGKA
ncbi:antiterminator LoaP [Breznakiella homolactica]|uniref:Antiterminator LoaP n=2 Tax=Breznakiella homolactica TaxID=2798577 RepID=A0A7T7XKF3_9SPIR|nr:antiterminator LoaP [Breznakiella homolactica]QQO08055.1 antiterminator LoaP [Breznakiella homolactica]